MRMFHPHYSHHHYGSRLKGKLILAGVTLWLTSTITAGVRRSTGWTHNAYGQPRLISTSNNQDEEEQAWQAFIVTQSYQSRRYADRLSLEQQYLDSAPDQHSRQLREQRLERFCSSSYPHFYRHQCHPPHGGFTLWYLGIGERTFNWVARKLGSSPRFHHEHLPVSYDALVSDMVNREPITRHDYYYSPHMASSPYIAGAAVAPAPAAIPATQGDGSAPDRSGQNNSSSSDAPATQP
ncbi:hypothetical protein H4R24_001907 [Coemansia sp. RSA 988]|nr:hypothetical protein H4R24_001907 [Coemansia sp. RSA 988]